MQRITALFRLFRLFCVARIGIMSHHLRIGNVCRNSRNSRNGVTNRLNDNALRVPNSVPTRQSLSEQSKPCTLGATWGNRGSRLSCTLNYHGNKVAALRRCSSARWAGGVRSPAFAGGGSAVRPVGCHVHRRWSKGGEGIIDAPISQRVLPAGGWSDRGASSTDIFACADVQRGCASDLPRGSVLHFSTSGGGR